MLYKIAVASSDGKVVNQHFGHSRQFLIFQADDTGRWEFLQMRLTEPACSMGEHRESSMEKVVRLLSDCNAVIVSQIGFGALLFLKSAQIQAFTVSDSIDSALEQVIYSLSEKIH